MMEIHIRELASRGDRLPIQASLNADWLKQIRKDIVSVGALNVNLEAYGLDGVAHVEGQLDLDVEMSCSRCLEAVKQSISIPFAEKFKHAKNEEEDEEVIAVEEDKFDLEPLIEETMMLSLPFAPLCKEDCKGLCTSCGANLNEAACGCSQEKIDPRLAALKDVFKQS
ncbi:YceD family protein [Paenibacillus sp. GCM10027626]|uniref:YceD family protein n=1 Tax=Paenibacillus sp. GCM10027626 TaxID=3273411 RepID=UPI0036255A19